MMMRLNFKTTLLVLVVATLSFLLASWNNCGSLLFTKHQHKAGQIYDLNNITAKINFNVLIHISALKIYIFMLYVYFNQDRVNTESGYQEIDCHINGDYSIGCRKEGDEVYIPFSFIHKYFEVSHILS